MLSTRIRRARTIGAVTQAELARRVGVQRSAVAQWESANGTSPSLAHLARIAYETSVCFEWLATGRGPSRPEQGLFDLAVVTDDYALDHLESRALNALRRLGSNRKKTLVEAIELLSA